MQLCELLRFEKALKKMGRGTWANFLFFIFLLSMGVPGTIPLLFVFRKFSSKQGNGSWRAFEGTAGKGICR